MVAKGGQWGGELGDNPPSHASISGGINDIISLYVCMLLEEKITDQDHTEFMRVLLPANHVLLEKLQFSC